MSRAGEMTAGCGKAALVCLLLLICIWPALYNGQPVFFPDSSTYIRVADAGIAQIFGRRSVWSAPPLSARVQTGGGHIRSISNPKEKFVLGGKSVYYGLLLYLGDLFSRFWLTIVLQALVVLVALSLMLRSTVGFRWLSFAVIVGGLALTTPMAFYVSFLMADIFAAVTILAAANLLVYGAAMTRLVWLVWAGLLCVSLLFHISHLLLAIAMLAVFSVGALAARRSPLGKGLVAVTVSIGAAIAGTVAFTLAVTKMVGEPPVQPPLLSVRTIVDGPGAAYLAARCPQAQFAMCRFADQPAVAAARSSPDVRCTAERAADEAVMGLFIASDPGTRRALSAEQYAFVAAVLAYDPAAEIAAALRDAAVQLGCFGLAEFDYRDHAVYFEDRVPPAYLGGMKRSRAWNGALPVELFSTLGLVVVAGAAIYVAGCLLRIRFRRENARALARFVRLVLIGVVLNACICGVLSGPYDRYQARVIWLVPLTAALLFQRRSGPAASTTDADPAADRAPAGGGTEYLIGSSHPWPTMLRGSISYMTRTSPGPRNG